MKLLSSSLPAAVLFLCLAGPLSAAPSDELRESAELEAVFQRAGSDGTFVLMNPDGAGFTVRDADRARTRFVPASTFKIPNTLIGLETGAVGSVAEILPYGGKPQPYPTWERDMSLRDAIKISNVPVYQELARRIGLERMQAGVQKLGYGNEEIGTVVDRFWLDGPLMISAVEQAQFLHRLASGGLPFSARAVAGVKEITLLESFPDEELHGKTGWSGSAAPQIGWFVGWVKRGNAVYAFALNMTVKEKEDLPKRIALAKECLQVLGVLPIEKQ